MRAAQVLMKELNPSNEKKVGGGEVRLAEKKTYSSDQARVLA